MDAYYEVRDAKGALIDSSIQREIMVRLAQAKANESGEPHSVYVIALAFTAAPQQEAR